MGKRGTQAEYAEHLSVSRAYVTKLGKQGRLVFVGNLVDFDATDVKIHRTTDLGRAANGRNASGSRFAGSAATPSQVEDVFRKAQAQERVHNARLLELRYKRESGEVIPIADIRAAYARRISSVRDALLQIPARLAPVIAAETDEAKVHELLQNELYLVLEHAVE